MIIITFFSVSYGAEVVKISNILEKISAAFFFNVNVVAEKHQKINAMT
jgi:hypothetical protein